MSNYKHMNLRKKKESIIVRYKDNLILNEMRKRIYALPRSYVFEGNKSSFTEYWRLFNQVYISPNTYIEITVEE